MSYEPQPYLKPLLGGFDSPELQRHESAAASRIASQEQMAFDRALGSPPRAQPQPLQLKQPTLPNDFAQRVADLDREIYGRGIAIDADKLIEHGKERFEQLLAAARHCREPRSVPAGDLTSFGSVQIGLHSFEAPTVPRRTTMEQVNGSGKEREAVRQIRSWNDLWKFAPSDPEPVTKAYAFYDLFASLIFGQSILERLSADGRRVRSHLFTGGKGRKVDLFREWLFVIEGSLTSVTLKQPLWHVMSWLADEKAPTPSHKELAQDFFNMRVPSEAQIKLAQAVLDGFLLGYREWPLWEFVSNATRKAQDESRLAAWRKELATHYRGVTVFHEELRAYFHKDVDSGDVRHAHREFDSGSYRAFVNRTTQKLLDQLFAVLALAIAETFPNAVVARFQGQILCEGQPEQRAEITARLAAAFPRATFPIAFEEVRP
jgi:hypothetical protein